MEKLFNSQAVTEKQYDDAITAYDLAVSKHNTAKQNVNKIKSARPEEIEQAEANLVKAESSISNRDGIDKQILFEITKAKMNYYIRR